VRNVAERLDVVDHSRIKFIGTSHEEALHIRREVRLAGHGGVSFDHFQQRFFLPEQVVLWTENQFDRNQSE
jgi:hypothetical protein